MGDYVGEICRKVSEWAAKSELPDHVTQTADTLETIMRMRIKGYSYIKIASMLNSKPTNLMSFVDGFEDLRIGSTIFNFHEDDDYAYQTFIEIEFQIDWQSKTKLRDFAYDQFLTVTELATAVELGGFQEKLSDFGFTEIPKWAIIRAKNKQSPTPFPSKQDETKKRDSYLNNLRFAASLVDGVLTTAKYEKLYSAEKVSGPGSLTIIHFFGSWNLALQSAGLATNPSSPIANKKRWTRKDMKSSLALCEKIVGHRPSVDEYDLWRKSQDSAPSSATIRNEFKSWLAAFE